VILLLPNLRFQLLSLSLSKPSNSSKMRKYSASISLEMASLNLRSTSPDRITRRFWAPSAAGQEVTDKDIGVELIDGTLEDPTQRQFATAR
jgi:hypothetical protein